MRPGPTPPTAARRRAPLLAALLVALAGPGTLAQEQTTGEGTGAAPRVAEEAPAAWRVICTWIRGQADQLADDLETARLALHARAQAEAPALVDRLTKKVPARRDAGWGILPEIREDGPFRSVEPTERKYALRPISRNFVSAFRDGRVLADHTAARPTAPLEQAVADYERLRGDLKNLRDHLSYHEHWQATADDPAQEAFFAERNAIVKDVRAWRELVQDGGDAARIAELAAGIRARVSRFRNAPDLALQTMEDGSLSLPVPVHTDIADATFLGAFRRAVEDAWNDSAAATDRRLVIDLELVVVSPEELYPEGPPAKGDAIDTDEHLERFPEDTLVMTTGAASTHAWKGRCLLIGPSPISPRTLAHEFGHLLGFDDAYLRGYDGRPGGPFGVDFVEWTGLLDDLMGNPGGGRVTKELVDQLVEAYGQP